MESKYSTLLLFAWKQGLQISVISWNCLLTKIRLCGKPEITRNNLIHIKVSLRHRNVISELVMAELIRLLAVTPVQACICTQLFGVH
jgi:hypothetical protein